jgi:hypothetical protein
LGNVSQKNFGFYVPNFGIRFPKIIRAKLVFMGVEET